jgi:hypothetical protein
VQEKRRVWNQGAALRRKEEKAKEVLEKELADLDVVANTKALVERALRGECFSEVGGGWWDGARSSCVDVGIVALATATAAPPNSCLLENCELFVVL